MRTNRPRISPRTHEGAVARIINPEQELRRSLMACLLWEDTFYENGVSIAERIRVLTEAIEPDRAATLMVEARNKMKLRHVPLWVAVGLSERGLRANQLNEIIQRPDEMCEFLSLYWGKKKHPLSAQVKKGLRLAFSKFDAYQLSKYNRPDKIKLRDVLCIVRPKPKDKDQSATWKKLLNGTLEPPDTWESALVSGKDKKTSFERLLKEKKLGGLALLRNLRNMAEAKVEKFLIADGLADMNTRWILPFRFIAAARYAPQWENEIEAALFKCLSEQKKLSGRTVVVVDVSGSMTEIKLSGKSDMSRMDAACGLAICVRELCDEVEIYAFSTESKRIAARRGFALRDAIVNSLPHGSTYLQEALSNITSEYDRIIVITDEQSHDKVDNPAGRGYMINVGNYQNGVGYGEWLHIDGFSEAILNYIAEYEGSLKTE